MTPVFCQSGRDVALFGLGGSGLATARALVAGGARVNVWDDTKGARERAASEGLRVVDLQAADWAGFDSFVLSPGVPLTHPEPHWTVRKARAASVEIIGDIELFCRERARLARNSPFVAITGTNGKSTTTALIAHILREARNDVQMGGNIGTPVLALEPPAMERCHVIECSSFQIDLAPSLSPYVGVLLNLTPDHIDRHGAMENYAAVKERLVARSRFAVVGVDDDFCKAIVFDLRRAGVPVLEISKRNARLTRHGAGEPVLAGSGSASGQFVDLGDARALRGAHNGQNAAAAFRACELLFLPPADIRQGIRGFPGLPHRMEEVARLGRVVFVNDSKATNADAAEKALLSYDDIFWIIGGKSKEGGVEPLRPLFAKVRKAFLIGAASDDFGETLGTDVAHEYCGTLDAAIARAAAEAAKCDAAEPVVLLSPACASYDQDPNFEVRGNSFRDLARALVARAGNAPGA